MAEIRTIFGPPGCGKTRTLVEYAQREAAKNPVTFISYTRAAAQEAASRITEGRVKASTIHSLVFNELGLSRSQVVDWKKLDDFSNTTGFKFRKGEDDDEQDGDMYRSVISFAVANIRNLSETYEFMGSPGTHKGFENFCISYKQWKSTYGYVDFDDMLMMCRTREFPTYPIIMLDEAQDCSPLQWEVFNRICAKSKRVYVVGDDDQSIFEWNGADPHGMIRFSEENNAKIRVLEQSYRVPRSVFDLVHDDILSGIERRVEKKFAPANKEGSILRYADLIDSNLKPFYDMPGTTMVLVRDKYRMKEIQRNLHADNVPYSIAGSNSSPYDNVQAHAIRGWQSGGPTGPEQEAMKKISRNPNATIEEILKTPWKQAFKIPEYLIEFYEHADLNAPVTVKLSTIHQSKGTEADKVVVDLTTTGRVTEGMFNDRDAELRVWYVALTRTKDRLIMCGENALIP